MILVDAGPLIAAFSPRDAFHQTARTFFRNNRDTLVLPVPVVAEVAHLVSERAGAAAELRFLHSITANAFRLECPDPADYARAAGLVEQYANFPFGTVDALIVAMAERLDVTRLLTLDRRHFGAVRPVHCDAFDIVP